MLVVVNNKKKKPQTQLCSPGGVGRARVVGETDGGVDRASKLLCVAVDHARTLSDELADLVGVGRVGLDVPDQQGRDGHHLLRVQVLSLVFREPS